MRHLGFTLGMTCIGFALAGVLGVALGSASSIAISRAYHLQRFWSALIFDSKVALAPLS